MYKIFDNFLKEKNLNFKTDFFDDYKVYGINENIDGNLITVLITIGKTNIYHSVGLRLIENFNSDKEIDYIKLANEYNLKYKNLCCVVSEGNNFEVNRYYIAPEESFDPELLTHIACSLVDLLKDGLLKEACRIKYR